MPSSSDNLFDPAFLARLEYLRIVARRTFAGTAQGGRTGRRTGPGLEFAEHRAYTPGDDYRHIDWAAYGRLERLLLRLCQEEEDLAIYFLVDASASMATGRPAKFDHARRLAAALAYVALASLDRVRIIAIDGGVRGHMEAGRGKTHIVGVLDFLRGLATGGRTDLARAVDAFLPHASARGLVVLISDLLDPAGYEKPLLQLHGGAAGRSGGGGTGAGGFDLWCLHVTDPADLAPPGLGDLAVADAETGETVAVHLTDDIRTRLAAEAARYGEEVRAWCLARGIGYAAAPTSLPPDELVLDVLRSGGMVR